MQLGLNPTVADVGLYISDWTSCSEGTIAKTCWACATFVTKVNFNGNNDCLITLSERKGKGKCYICIAPHHENLQSM